jgi:HlyD family secretion protein
MTATVNFVANQPEYTPPIIYSLDARQKLVFMIEADPSIRAPSCRDNRWMWPPPDGLPRR